MADVKWIKITTDMFDNRKIKHLRRLPDGNNIVLIWVMLLTMAGRCNASGMVFLTETIPYTPKMLADELDFEESTVQLALTVMEQLNMIRTDGSFFSIAGWEEYQSVEGLDKIREQNRIRQAKFKEKQKLINSNVTGNVTVTQGNATDIDKEEDKDKEKEEDIDKDIFVSDETKSSHKKNVRHKYGQYDNVLLSDVEYEKLKVEFPEDYQDRIERLSEYMASTGKTYKNHLATIRCWARKNQSKASSTQSVKQPQSEYDRFMSDLQEIYNESE